VKIGTIVASNSHISYLCRVFGRLESQSPPEPDDFAFGTFVSIRPVENGAERLIGVVRDTVLVNPEYGQIGPRLSSDRDLEVFSPDYLDEKGTLVEVLVLGWRDGDRTIHRVPPLAAQVGNPVETVPRDEIVAFHRDSAGRFFMGYLPQLVARPDPVVAGLLLGILDRLEPDFRADDRVIDVLRRNLAWKAHVVPAG